MESSDVAGGEPCIDGRATQGFTEAALGVLLVLRLYRDRRLSSRLDFSGVCGCPSGGRVDLGAAGPRFWPLACARNWERRPNLGGGCDSGSPKAVLTFVVIWLMRPAAIILHEGLMRVSVVIPTRNEARGNWPRTS